MINKIYVIILAVICVVMLIGSKVIIDKYNAEKSEKEKYQQQIDENFREVLLKIEVDGDYKNGTEIENKEYLMKNIAYCSVALDLYSGTSFWTGKADDLGTYIYDLQRPQC